MSNSFAFTVAPGDPLGTVSQDPDQVRNDACRLVAPDRTCTPVTVATSSSSAGSSAPFGIVSALGWAGLLVGLAMVLYVLARSIGKRSPRRHDDDVDGDEQTVDELGTIVDRRREPTNWRREADEHRRAGRYRDALRCRYRALVGDLARRGLIDEIPGRTTGEERAQLHRVLPAAAVPFDRAADLFDGAWYGDVVVGERDDDAFVALERDVLGAGTRSGG